MNRINDLATLIIYASRPMMRKCKEKDRVEENHQQLEETDSAQQPHGPRVTQAIASHPH